MCARMQITLITHKKDRYRVRVSTCILCLLINNNIKLQFTSLSPMTVFRRTLHSGLVAIRVYPCHSDVRWHELEMHQLKKRELRQHLPFSIYSWDGSHFRRTSKEVPHPWNKLQYCVPNSGPPCVYSPSSGRSACIIISVQRSVVIVLSRNLYSANNKIMIHTPHTYILVRGCVHATRLHHRPVNGFYFFCVL